jgi:dipeptidyl aminopeptidase/acylaminoacyl peptidase
VETEFVLYPREPHGFQEAKHRVDVQTRMLAWFDKYLKNAK